MPVWDPVTYLEFADERSRPFLDLLSRAQGRSSQARRGLGLRTRPTHRLAG